MPYLRPRLEAGVQSETLKHRFSLGRQMPDPRNSRKSMVESSYLAVIKVVGAGGGGTNAVARMVDAGPQGRRVHRDQHRRPGAAGVRGGHQAVDRAPAHQGPRRGGKSRDRGRRRRREPRRHQGGAEGRRHGLRHCRRGRRDRHRRRSRDRRDRQGGDRSADGRRDHEAVRVRGQSPHAAGPRRDRQAARQVRHADHRPEREAAAGRGASDVGQRGVPDGRRHPPAGRPGHHRFDHDAGPDQPRLRRRARGDVGSGLGDDGRRGPRLARTAPPRPRRVPSPRR